MPYENKAYAKFKLINYEIRTSSSGAAIKEVNIDYTAKGNDYTSENYLPVPQGLNEDMTLRLKRLAKVIDMANEHLKQDASNNGVLKIFMVPEYYFRPKTKKNFVFEGKGGEYYTGYTADEKKALEAGIKNMFKHKDFDDWLFVLGTVLWHSDLQGYFSNFENLIPQAVKEWNADKDDSEKSDKEKALEKFPIVLNTAMIIKGGNDGPFHTMEKLNFSLDDTVDDKSKNASRSYLGYNCGALMGKWAARQRSLFEIDNLRYGIEMCRDHDVGFQVLKSTCIEARDFGQRNNDWLHFHLLVSAGISVKPTSVIAKTGGYVLHSDAKYTPQTEIYEVEKQVFTDIRELDQAGNLNKSGAYPAFLEKLAKDGKVTLLKPSVDSSTGAFEDIELSEDLQVPRQVTRHYTQNVDGKELNSYAMETAHEGHLVVTCDALPIPK